MEYKFSLSRFESQDVISVNFLIFASKQIFSIEQSARRSPEQALICQKAVGNLSPA